MTRNVRLAVPSVLLGALLAAAPLADAREVQEPGRAPSLAIDGPPAPVPPEVVSRDDRGRATIRTVRIDSPLTIDGTLEERTYEQVQPIGGFIQQEPHEGAPTTEKTDVWVFFDDVNLYVAARCWDSQPEREVITELRRDSANMSQNENFVVILDTFYDRRNGFYFQTTPIGALRDQAITDEGNANSAWNTVWYAKSRRFEGGWTMEMAIPFKSLRYNGSGPQVWGINLRRTIRWKNESAFLTRVPAQWTGNGIYHVSVAGTLVGLETPASSMNLELKPYVVASLTTDNTTPAPSTNQFGKNLGFDVKYGLSRSLIADASYNTDFAQVEEDLQQVNLTRFNLQFPEKRDFFLEGQGVYAFGGASLGTGGGLLNQGWDTAGDIPVLFFSRQIGLSEGQAVPVIAGGRLTGKVNRYTIGLLNIETGDKPSAGALRSNFSAARFKRDILRKSSIGIVATRRGPSAGGASDNLVVGTDLNLSFFRTITLTGYFAKTQTDGRKGNDTSYRTRFDYNADRYGLALEETMVGPDFNPEIGFVRRYDFARTYALVRFSPRPKNNRLVRQFNFQGTFDHVTSADRTLLENRDAKAMFTTEFHSGDSAQADYTQSYEFLPRKFTIAPGVVVPVGGYDYHKSNISYSFGQQRPFSGRVAVAYGTFYGGNKTEVNLRSSRAILTPRIAVEPGLSLNWVDLPYGDFSARLLNARIVAALTPYLAISSLVQFNASAHTLSSSVRLRWEYTPNSELFLVYSDGRNTLASGAAQLMNRSIAVKITKLVRF